LISTYLYVASIQEKGEAVIEVYSLGNDEEKLNLKDPSFMKLALGISIMPVFP
jgi:hypothetical protein